MKTEQQLWEKFRDQIDSYGKAGLNFDLERVHEYTKANGWNVDDYEAELPPEPPGEPLPNGSWKAAQKVLREYRFPPPDLITGIFVPDSELNNRVMVLRGQFLMFKFYFGVRVVDVVDEVRDGKNGKEYVWGYSYRTLQGHFEMGQITFTIIKNATTGKVLFTIHAFSKTGHIANPFYRLGFKMFGRKLQVRFAHESMKRMQMLVTQEITTGGDAIKHATQPEIKTTHSEPAAQEQLEKHAGVDANQPTAQKTKTAEAMPTDQVKP